MSTPSTQFCSEYSRQASEPLTATATTVAVWFLIEHQGMWGKHAFEESDLPEAVKDHLFAVQKSVQGTRIELIKQERRPEESPFAFYVALSRDIDPRLYQFDLNSYQDVLRLDLVKIASADPTYDDRRVDKPLYIVCTNGKRDQCCAKFGLPIYQAVARRGGVDVWQCTHLGGHRLGPNMVVLPAGVTYGRVSAADLDHVLDAERIHLPNYRGRSCYDAPVQAAETLLREHTSDTGLSAFAMRGAHEVGENSWAVDFATADGSAHRVRVALGSAGFGTYASCGDAETSEITRFSLEGIETR